MTRSSVCNSHGGDSSSAQGADDRSLAAPLPEAIGPYALGPRLGVGGMTDVWQAVHRPSGRRVALKLLRGGAERGRHLEREARVLARLDHPGIVRVLGLEREGDLLALVLELVGGADLAAWLAERGPLGEEQAWEVAAQVAGALAHAAELGVLHGDLKPGNVLWEGTAARGRARVCDFGLARTAAAGGSLASGSVAELAGTLPYLAPEKLVGAPHDERADVYALGVTLHELVTGSRPAGGEATRDVRRLRPGLGEQLAELIARLAHPDPARRPGSWAEVLRLVGVLRAEGTPLTPCLLLGTALVPGGPYLIGWSGPEALASERPRVGVQLAEFRADLGLFRHADLLALLERFPDEPELARWRGAPGGLALDRERSGLVLTGVTWAEADALARLTGGRLPTSLEWEALVRTFPGAVVSGHQEWCSDPFEEGRNERLAGEQPGRPGAPLGGPAYPCRSVVGAGHGSALPRRPSFRLGYPPETRRTDLGFRVVDRGRAGRAT